MAAEINAHDRVLYFYGITESRPANSIQQPGIDLQSHIEGIDCEGLTCWIGRVSAVEFEKDLERIKDADEWGIKVFAGKAAPVPVPQVHSGKDYLKAKAALLPTKRSRSDMNGEFAEFENALGKVAVESAAVGNVSSGQRGLRFQTSLLVKRKDRKKLESVLKKFSERWAEARQIECTGPWPPYSFVSRPGERVEKK